MKRFFNYFFFASTAFFCGCHTTSKLENSEIVAGLKEADPTIFHYQGKYFLYGTSGDSTVNVGIHVYASSNLKKWYAQAGNNNGFALEKGKTFGSKSFWAPQVFKKGNRFYMTYAANEEIAIASSRSPSGPFEQKITQPLFNDNFKHIDPYILKDGRAYYIYFVKLDHGNKIYVARLKNDLSTVIAGTERECIEADFHWENMQNSDWPVTEGPTVIKHKGIYYLFYTANDFRSIDYAVGYATAGSPYGPWVKWNQNPIISRKNTAHNGTGHGDIFRDNSGQYYYVLHVHNTNQVVSPRKTAIVPFKFVSNKRGIDSVVVDSQNFRLL